MHLETEKQNDQRFFDQWWPLKGWIYLVIVVDAKLPKVDYVDYDVDVNVGIDFVDPVK